MSSRRVFWALLACAMIVLSAAAPAIAREWNGERPVKKIEHAVVISCDGLRPDLMLRADAPNLRKMLEKGTFTMWARTVAVSITLPSHTSMLTGVTQERHGINWNDDRPEEGYPKVPTLFEIAKKAGMTTGMVTGKSKFLTLNKPGTVDWASIAGSNDEDVAKRAVSLIREHKPDVLFVHFPGADTVGHAKGWGTPEQLERVEVIDKQIGLVLDALKSKKRDKNTAIILSADHGGMGISHGGEDPRSRHIPWILVGPGIRKNYDLTRDPTLTVNTEDTFATMCFLLGLKPDENIDGKPIEAALEDRELLKDD